VTSSSDVGFISMPAMELKKKRVIVIGYPGDRADQLEGPVMWEDDGEVVNVSEGEFVHKANTDQGNSGGPVFLDESIAISGEPETIIKGPIVGVHVRGTTFIKSAGNYATLINPHYDSVRNILNGTYPDSWDTFPCFQPEGGKG